MESWSAENTNTRPLQDSVWEQADSAVMTNRRTGSVPPFNHLSSALVERGKGRKIPPSIPLFQAQISARIRHSARLCAVGKGLIQTWGEYPICVRTSPQ
jgi:hypothetical protein